MIEYLIFFISNIFVNNFILVQFLGMCPFVGASNKIDTAIGISLATTFVITFSSMLAWIINNLMLVPFHLVFLRVMTYILIISVSVQAIEIMIKKYSFVLYKLLGIYLPLITTNCAVLAVPILNANLHHNFIMSTLYGLSLSCGFSIVMIIFSSMRERIYLSDVPTIFKGTPIALITAGLMSMSFMGLNGLIRQ